MKQTSIWLSLLLLLAPACVQSQPWKFTKPIAISSNHGEKIFHHLESSGRHNIAISADTVAVAWEDNRDGTPRIYLARKGRNSKVFLDSIKISGAGEAYEPSLVALSNNQFVLSWEEDARIHLRLVTPSKLGPVITLAASEAAQPSLTYFDSQLLLVYARRDNRYSRIWMQDIEVDGQELHLKKACVVDSDPPQNEQSYPSIIKLPDRKIVAWEDRRLGHTIIMAAQSDKKKSCRFHSPQRISDALPNRTAKYGTGHGVARVALAQFGAGKVLAAWADKRDFREGYDIYAAHYQPNGKQLFTPNIKVQDSFGDVAQQWHTTVAGDQSGRLVVGWDDKRDGDANIMLSWLEGNNWSEDLAVPGADGPGEQNHPTISIDQEGNLHLAWVERTTINGPSQLRYLFGRLNKE